MAGGAEEGIFSPEKINSCLNPHELLFESTKVLWYYDFKY
jgi:hypothetical protein